MFSLFCSAARVSFIYVCPCHTCDAEDSILLWYCWIPSLVVVVIVFLFAPFIFALDILSVICCAQYKRQPTDCHRCHCTGRARTVCAHSKKNSDAKSQRRRRKWEQNQQNKYQNEDEWDQIGKHKAHYEIKAQNVCHEYGKLNTVHTHTCEMRWHIHTLAPQG